MEIAQQCRYNRSPHQPATRLLEIYKNLDEKTVLTFQKGKVDLSRGLSLRRAFSVLYEDSAIGDKFLSVTWYAPHVTITGRTVKLSMVSVKLSMVTLRILIKLCGS